MSRAEVDNSADPNDSGPLLRALEAKITSRDSQQGYLKLIVDYNKAITDLNFRKGAILQTNSIYLSEGEWNPEAYEDARIRGEAMSRALDNAHLETVPEEFVGGADVNSWESLGIPSRPFEPGAIENVNRIEAQPRSTVPEVPVTKSNRGTDPLPETPPPAEDLQLPPAPVVPSEENFIDPINYQSHLTPESRASSHPFTAK